LPRARSEAPSCWRRARTSARSHLFGRNLATLASATLRAPTGTVDGVAFRGPVRIDARSGVRVQFCTFAGPHSPMLLVCDGANPVIHACTLSSGSDVGVKFEGATTHGLLNDCRVANHAAVGVKVHARASPILRQCILRQNRVGVSIDAASPRLFFNVIAGSRVGVRMARLLRKTPPYLATNAIHGNAVGVTGMSLDGNVAYALPAPAPAPAPKASQKKRCTRSK